MKLEKYFKLTDSSPLYITAIILHPAWRFEYFEDKWAKYLSWIKTARKTFKNLYLKYHERIHINSAYDFESQTQAAKANEPKSSFLELESFNVFSADYLSRRYQKQKQKDTESLELNNYLRTFDPRLQGIKNLLTWWKEH